MNKVKSYLARMSLPSAESAGRAAGWLVVWGPALTLINWLTGGQILVALCSTTPTPAQMFLAAFLGATIAAS